MSRDFNVQPVRVVHLIHSVAHGGVETILVNWLQRLRKSRIDVRLVCFANTDHSEEPFLEACRRDGISVDTIPWSRRKPIFSAATRLSRILSDHKAEILHTHNTYADIVGLLCRRDTLRLASSVYVWSDFGWKRNLLQAINQFALRRYDCVISQCGATRDELIRRGMPEATSRVVISGFDGAASPLPAAERLQRRRAHGIDDHMVLFANVARCYPEKAQRQLLDAFRAIRDQAPHARLWIYGTGPLEDELKAYAREIAVTDIVRFAGFTPDIDAELRLADAQVHPSFAEGVPLAVCSGMAAGLPLVGSAVGGIPEMIEDEVTGLLVPAAAEADFMERFIAAIARLASESDTRNRLGLCAKRFMENEYSMQAALEQLFEVYASLLAT